MKSPAVSGVALSRGRALAATAAGLLGLVATALPRSANATPADVQKALATFGSTPPAVGKVTITAPEIAENGNTVPVSVTIDSPMTEANYVKKITMLADGNPQAEVASFELTPAMGQAHVELRIRLAQTQNVIAIAQMSDGTTFMATKPIKVTIGGCGG
ncbi:MAG: thiosulfate oxidation carrier protein SoxY [Candidatus Velthaea sp.]